MKKLSPVLALFVVVIFVVGIFGEVAWAKGPRDRDNNPPGQAGGPGTNWENQPGPQGGPGASPDRRPWWKDGKGEAQGQGTTTEPAAPDNSVTPYTPSEPGSGLDQGNSGQSDNPSEKDKMGGDHGASGKPDENTKNKDDNANKANNN